MKTLIPDCEVIFNSQINLTTILLIDNAARYYDFILSVVTIAFSNRWNAFCSGCFITINFNVINTPDNTFPPIVH